MITDPDYWRAVAIVTAQPAYVTKHGFTPAARAVVAALTVTPQTMDELAGATGYSVATVKLALSALARLGEVERPTNYKLEPNIWYVKGAAQDAD